MSRSTAWGVALLVVGITVGAAGAQAVQLLTLPHFLNTGLFTLGKGETALFNVTLDDNRGGPPANVLMELIDPRGVTVVRQTATLGPGQSATLKYDVPGIYRAHAQIVSGPGELSDRRALITSLEILGDPLGGLSIPRVYVCSSSDDGGGPGRLPD
jgi:hypothetical protein